jgi:hypothetical protein
MGDNQLSKSLAIAIDYVNDAYFCILVLPGTCSNKYYCLRTITHAG